MNYTIGEFSKITNLSIFALRFYEKEGLIKPKRNNNNQRFYTENDLNWIIFILKLKESNMPIKEIKKYSDLREQGDLTLNQRYLMLIDHKKNIEINIKKMEDILNNLENKISFYENEINK